MFLTCLRCVGGGGSKKLNHPGLSRERAVSVGFKGLLGLACRRHRCFCRTSAASAPSTPQDPLARPPPWQPRPWQEHRPRCLSGSWCHRLALQASCASCAAAAGQKQRRCVCAHGLTVRVRAGGERAMLQVSQDFLLNTNRGLETHRASAKSWSRSRASLQSTINFVGCTQSYDNTIVVVSHMRVI